MLRIKDSMNIFYKRVETQVDEEDQDYNIISHKFGYKSCFVRCLECPQYIFEQYVPIVASKAR